MFSNDNSTPTPRTEPHSSLPDPPTCTRDGARPKIMQINDRYIPCCHQRNLGTGSHMQPRKLELPAEYYLNKRAMTSWERMIYRTIKMDDHLRLAEIVKSPKFNPNMLLIEPGCIKEEPLLFIAIRRGSTKILETLLRAGVDPNIKSNGTTPLHFAASLRNISKLKLMTDPTIGTTADINAVNDNNLTAYDTYVKSRTEWNKMLNRKNVIDYDEITFLKPKTMTKSTKKK